MRNRPPVISRGRRTGLASIGAGAALLAACATVFAAPSWQGAVWVRVPSRPAVASNVTVSFHPRGALPRGGYYYAVIVLRHYPVTAANAVPSCATSSDMGRTVYGFPRRGRAVSLPLIASGSPGRRWCPGSRYEGAVYAVPHRPPCTASYPCYGAGAAYGACWEVEGHRVCGVVAKPEPPTPEPPGGGPPPGPASYSYPGGLPKPIDRSARVVGRFVVRFPGVAGPARAASAGESESSPGPLPRAAEACDGALS